MNENKPLILLCRCSRGENSFAKAQERMALALEKVQLPFQSIDDLCGLAAQKDDDLRMTLESRSVTFLACHSRAVKWLLQWAEADSERSLLINSREGNPEAIVARLVEMDRPNGAFPHNSFKKTGDWVPWFPVIDHDRCKNCKQCLSFCLFGVYGLDEQRRVAVVNPQGCKTNCPACARICPEVAIMFPKYNQAPINGAPILDEDAERAKVKVNMQEILGSDVYGALAERKKKARSLLVRRGSGAGSANPSDSQFHPLPKP